MIKRVSIVLACMLALPAEAQTPEGPIASRYTEFLKSRAAVKACVGEEGRMQIARNARYDALLRESAKDPAEPTIDEMAAAQGQLRSEDEALSQKREECTPLFDQLAAAARELRRGCAAYAAPSGNGEPAATDALATKICGGSASSDADKSGNP